MGERKIRLGTYAAAVEIIIQVPEVAELVVVDLDLGNGDEAVTRGVGGVVSEPVAILHKGARCKHTDRLALAEGHFILLLRLVINQRLCNRNWLDVLCRNHTPENFLSEPHTRRGRES